MDYPNGLQATLDPGHGRRRPLKGGSLEQVQAYAWNWFATGCRPAGRRVCRP